MSLGTMHIYSSQYEERNYEALMHSILMIAKKNDCKIEDIKDGKVRYQRLYPRTKTQVKNIRSALKMIAISHAWMT